MSGYYPNPGHSIPPQYYNIDPNTNIQHAPPSVISHGSYTPTLPDNPFQPVASGAFVQYENVGQPNYADQFEDLSGPMGAAHGGNGRARRRPAPGEQVKHRRTRSGCYMCRQRRVKCDEARPVCERECLVLLDLLLLYLKWHELTAVARLQKGSPRMYLPRRTNQSEIYAQWVKVGQTLLHR
ncbi:C6 finger domain protein [Pyrenophora tritici-repentis]|nr:C6 finger domain protein [Pyrenophora tritici-repentis]